MEQAAGDRLPILAKGRNRLHFRGIRQTRRRIAVKTFKPNQLGCGDMDQRVAQRREAGAARFYEFLVRKLRGAVQGALVGPTVVVKKLAHVFGSHLPSYSFTSSEGIYFS